MLLVPPEELQPLLRRATGAGLDAAVHAIGDAANTLALDAFAASGARGRVEHAQLLARADLRPVRRARASWPACSPSTRWTTGTSPTTTGPAARDRAFAYRSLLDAGAGLVLGSDAPVAPLDPWVTLAAAVHRSGDGRGGWHPEQEIPLDVALAASAGPAGPIAVGRVADLVVTELDPAAVGPDRLRDDAGGRDDARRPLDVPPAQVSSSSLPVVRRPCRSSCAARASASGYVPPIRTSSSPAATAAYTAAARAVSSSRVAM